MNKTKICPYCKDDPIKAREGKIDVCYPCGCVGKSNSNGQFYTILLTKEQKLSEARKVFLLMRGM